MNTNDLINEQLERINSDELYKLKDCINNKLRTLQTITNEIAKLTAQKLEIGNQLKSLCHKEIKLEDIL